MPDHSTLTGAPAKRPKGQTIKALKRAKQRIEADVLTRVREEVFERDQMCRIAKILGTGAECVGDHQLMHLPPKRRSQTRNMSPLERHHRRFCIRACAFHHQQEEAHRLDIAPMTDRGADGPLLLLRSGRAWTEDQ